MLRGLDGGGRRAMGEGKMWRMQAISFLFVALVSLAWSCPKGVLADDEGQPVRRGHSPITYVGAGVTNVVYIPIKLVYAGSGGIVAGLAYLITAGDEKAFFGVWRRAAGGTYLVTPSMLEGKERFRFIGF